jgi:putative OPT family oligopeptide transporter
MSARNAAGIAEWTWKAIAFGLLFGCLFGAANAYLGLKAGLTVSTSIPIAVLSAAAFKMFRGGGTILEANLAQTIGSASSSLASGTIFTIPALFLWGFTPPVWQVALLAMAGGLLGILAMIPLRRLLIVQADAELPYPEGRACAEVLHATQKSASAGMWVFAGLALGAAIKLALAVFHLGPEEVAWRPEFLPNGSLQLAIAPALLAVGYIVGFRSASVMVSGALLASLVLYPLITKGYATGLLDAAASGMKGLDAGTARTRLIVYLGAGAVAAAAIVTIVRSAPTMAASLGAVVKGVRAGGSAGTGERTDRDVPPAVLLAGVASLVVALIVVPGIFAGELSLGARVVAALGVAVFGFLFVPVSSRLVGVIGVSSNPTSAMALITLAGTAGIFLALGWKGVAAQAAVLTVGTVVCVAASKAGDISQDLKTGWLVKGTPYLQQYGQLIAACVACWVVAAVVVALGHEPGFGEGGLAAPQARLMKTMVEVVLGAALPWDLLVMGGSLSLTGVLLGLPALPFALGIYLPPSTMGAVFVGGLVRRIAEARLKERFHAEAGILCASGLVAGEGLAGVFVAGRALAAGGVKAAVPPYGAFQIALSIALLVAAGWLVHRASRHPDAATAA